MADAAPRRNASGLEDRCESRVPSGERCTLVVGHSGWHLGGNDSEWDDRDAVPVRDTAQVRRPTPKQLVRAAEIVQRWAESRGDPTSQEYSMAVYTADNMRITALAESRNG